MILKTLKSIMATGESKNMENLFASLRADHDVGTLKLSKEKIEELKKKHVDVSGNISTLSTKAKKANGGVNLGIENVNIL